MMRRGIMATPMYPKIKPAKALPIPTRVPPLRLILLRDKCPKIIARTAAGKIKKKIPSTRLAVAIPLTSGKGWSFVNVRSLWHHLQILASSWISSAQYGHFINWIHPQSSRILRFGRVKSSPPPGFSRPRPVFGYTASRVATSVLLVIRTQKSRGPWSRVVKVLWALTRRSGNYVSLQRQCSRRAFESWLGSFLDLFRFVFSTGVCIQRLLRFVFRFVLSHFESPIFCFQ